MSRKAGVTALMIGLVIQTTHAMEVQPVIQAELLGGQYWYNGADNTLGALASLSASPFVKINERWSVVPLYQGRYQGTKQVNDFTGGGTLFQDNQTHNVSAKLVRSFENGLRLKAIGAYGIEWLRETKDEDWTKGLYDNRRLSAGIETEWAPKEDQSLRLAYDHYRVRFPNYQSLESQQSAGLGRELAQPDVLDNQNNRVMLAGRTSLPGKGWAEAQLSQIWRSFPDQRIVAATGDLTPEERSDAIQALSLEGTWPVAQKGRGRLFGTLGYGWTHLFSNQNSYDASKTVFSGNYYAYVQQTLQMRWLLVVGEENPWTLSWMGALGRQSYADRRIQDSVGQYGTEMTSVDSATVGLGLSYPIARGFQLKAQMYLGWNDSNNTYAQVYQYHYNTQSYLLGFSYAY